MTTETTENSPDEIKTCPLCGDRYTVFPDEVKKTSVSAVGNMAAMREALEHASYFLRRHHTGAVYAPDGETLIYCEDVAKIVDAALSAPPRNCDVGTADEQMKRQHDTMCNTTKACPDSDWSCRKCFAEWAQMPYEEGAERR